RSRVEFSLFTHPERTFYRGVRKLVPGTCLVAEGEEVRIQRFWEPPQREGRWREDEAVEELRHLLKAAVNCRLPGVGAIGTHLSGGLDSSIVTVLAAQGAMERGQRVSSFSWSLSGAPSAGGELRRINA